MYDIDKLARDLTGRRAFLRRASLVGLGAAAGVAGLAGCGSGSGGTSAGAAINGFSKAEVQTAFQNIMSDEDNHVKYLNVAIPANGGTARPAPTFDTTQAVWNPTSATQFYALADALENTGTGAYVYATQYLVSAPTVLVAAASIGLVEGRHAGFLNALTGRPLLTDPTPGENDQTTPTGKTYATLGSTPNYSQEVPQAPSTVAQRAAPFLVNVNLNGGPALPTDTFTGQGAVPFAVLNYALLLEYLEMMWYDRNVPKLLNGQIS